MYSPGYPQPFQAWSVPGPTSPDTATSVVTGPYPRRCQQAEDYVDRITCPARQAFYRQATAATSPPPGARSRNRKKHRNRSQSIPRARTAGSRTRKPAKEAPYRRSGPRSTRTSYSKRHSPSPSKYSPSKYSASKYSASKYYPSSYNRQYDVYHHVSALKKLNPKRSKSPPWRKAQTSRSCRYPSEHNREPQTRPSRVKEARKNNALYNTNEILSSHLKYGILRGHTKRKPRNFRKDHSMPSTPYTTEHRHKKVSAPLRFRVVPTDYRSERMLTTSEIMHVDIKPNTATVHCCRNLDRRALLYDRRFSNVISHSQTNRFMKTTERWSKRAKTPINRNVMVNQCMMRCRNDVSRFSMTAHVNPRQCCSALTRKPISNPVLYQKNLQRYPGTPNKSKAKQRQRKSSQGRNKQRKIFSAEISSDILSVPSLPQRTQVSKDAFVRKRSACSSPIQMLTIQTSKNKVRTSSTTEAPMLSPRSRVSRSPSLRSHSRRVTFPSQLSQVSFNRGMSSKCSFLTCSEPLSTTSPPKLISAADAYSMCNTLTMTPSAYTTNASFSKMRRKFQKTNIGDRSASGSMALPSKIPRLKSASQTTGSTIPYRR